MARKAQSLFPRPGYLPARAGTSTIIVNKYGEMQPQEISIESLDDLYTYEADTVATYLDARQAPAMSWDDTLGNMQTLDRWRQAIGLVYDAERPEAQVADGA